MKQVFAGSICNYLLNGVMYLSVLNTIQENIGKYQ